MRRIILNFILNIFHFTFSSEINLREKDISLRRVREIESQRLLTRARETTNLEEKLSLLREILDKFPMTQIASRLALRDLVYILDLLGEYLPAAQTLATYRSGGEEGGRPVIEAPYEEIYYLARLFYKLGRSDNVYYDKAIETFRLLIETAQDPNFQTLCQEWIGITYLAQGKYLAAFNTFNLIETPHRFVTAYRTALDLLIQEIGRKGKPIVGMGDMKRFAQNQKTPLYFFAAVPKGYRGSVSNEGFRELAEILNENFQYLSGGKFGLDFKGFRTIEVDFGVKDDMEVFLVPQEGLWKEVFNLYWHSLPEIYSLAGTGFIFIIDPRLPREVGWRYEGNGVISISGTGISRSMVPRLIHEILHGLDAIHYDDNIIAIMDSIEHRFEQEPDIMMSWGELPYLALSEFNRRRVGWPKVEPRRF